MLLRGRLTPVDSTRRHVVDELVVPVREPVLLALAVERDLRPLERAIGVAERTGAVLLGFGRCDTLGVADGTRVIDLGKDLLLVVFVQSPFST